MEFCFDLDIADKRHLFGNFLCNQLMFVSMRVGKS